VILAAAAAAQAATAFVLIGIGALTAAFRQYYDLNGFSTGLIVTAVALAPLFALLPVGRFLDHHSERPIIAGGAMIMGAGAAVAAVLPPYLLLLAVLLVGGAGYATAQPGGSKVVATWFDDSERGLAMGIRQSGLPLGGAAAAAVLPLVAEDAGLRPALLVAAAVAVAGGVLFWMVDRKPPTEPDRSGYRFRSEIRRAVADPDTRRAMWIGLAMVSGQFSVIAYLILYLHDELGIAVTTGAWMLFTTQMAGVAGRVALAWWSDRSPAGRLLPITTSMATAALVVVVLALLPAGTTVAAVAALALLVGFFGFGWYGPWVVHVAEISPSRSVGLTLAAAMTANQFAIVAAPPIFGLLLDASGGYLVPWLAVAAVLGWGAWRSTR
jgi:predicted MFS family arabinose efflux permease